jgi:3-phosphoshikimate 1-carboxyvinyltransferase
MITFNKTKSLKGVIEVPADKSITHRAIIFSSMAVGRSIIYNPLISEDTKATMVIMKKLGAKITDGKGSKIVESKGYSYFMEPNDVLDCRNSGTTARLLLGLLAPQRKYFVVTGDESLRQRPIDRVIVPLTKLGARIFGRNNDKLLPATILNSEMIGGKIEQVVASAQVKSAIILAAAQIKEEVIYSEKIKTRNHTELMGPAYGVNLKSYNNLISIKGGNLLKPCDIVVPGDFSSAAFYIAAALIFENSKITIRNVGLNPTRTAFIDILKNMGAKIYIELKNADIEPIGDISIEYGKYKGICIKGDIIANLIDEIPLLAMLGLFAESPVEVRDAKELRVKESDRIMAVCFTLKALGAKVEEYEDGFKVYPLENKLNDTVTTLESFSDHRIAMINILLAKKFGEKVRINEIKSIDISNPYFLSILGSIEEN